MGFETANHPETRHTHQLLPRNDPDRIHAAFDDHRLAANARLILPVHWPIILDWVNWWTARLTWEMPRVGPMQETSC